MTWALKDIVYAPNAVKKQPTTGASRARRNGVLTVEQNYSGKGLITINYSNKSKKKNERKFEIARLIVVE